MNNLHHPLSLTQVYLSFQSVFPVTVFSYLLEKKSFYGAEKKTTMNTDANLQNFLEGDLCIVAFLMVTRLFLQNNWDFQKVNSFSLYLSY